MNMAQNLTVVATFHEFDSWAKMWDWRALQSKAVQFDSNGGIDVLEVRDVSRPVPAELRSDAIAQLDEIVKGSSASVASRASD